MGRFWALQGQQGRHHLQAHDGRHEVGDGDEAETPFEPVEPIHANSLKQKDN